MASQAELEARLDFDEELPPLDTAALAAQIGALGQQLQVCAQSVAIDWRTRMPKSQGSATSTSNC